MIAALGILLVFFALLSALYATLASIQGARSNNQALVQSARNAALVTFPLLTVAALMLIGMLVSGTFNVEYVWSVSSNAMPTYLKVTALWGGQAGSLLFWSWILSAFSIGALLRNWKDDRKLMPYVTAILMGTLAFFVMLVLFWENPFVRFWVVPGQSQDVVAAMFAPSTLTSGIASAYASVANAVPGLFGTVLQEVAPIAPPLDSTLLPAVDGQGLNPLLRHIGMIIHPPMLYLGFIGFVVPFAFAMAALATGELSDAWIRSTRRWTLVAWMFLSLGLILGGRWAYDVLGWGGYWGWDPVENAAFMPWLSGTAFLHSVMIQEKRGMLLRWNMVLVTVTYLQVIWGTFLTRAGLVASVHSFAQSALGPLFLIFVAVALIVSVRLLMLRWDELRAKNRLDGLLSRESMFLLNNLLFLGINFAVFWGTHFPMLSELLTGQVITVGPPYYNRTTLPMFMGIVLLMGIAPLVAWKRASFKRLGRSLMVPAVLTLGMLAIFAAYGFISSASLLPLSIIALTASVTLLEFHRGAQARTRSRRQNYAQAMWTLIGRNRRRYGGYFIHLGVVVMAIGFVGSNLFQRETQQTVSAGETITVGDYVLRYNGLEVFTAVDDREVTRANVTVFRNGKEVRSLRPRIDRYSSGQPSTVPGNLSQFDEDFYVLLVGWEQISLNSATFKIYINPLINWVWGGGLVFVFGTFIAAWPNLAEERQRVVKTLPAAVPVGSH